MRFLKSLTAEDREALFVALGCVGIGSLLRALFPADMEWKGDERWLFEMSRRVAAGGPWPAVGMPSSQGTMNPGLSAWIFIVLGRFAPSDPIALVRGVQALNIVALWAWWGFILWGLEGERRRRWLWGLALFCVAPMPVLFARKIWQQDVLPIFGFLFFLGHWFRDKIWGSFGWGALTALLGQIHLSGFFFTPWVFFFTVGRKSEKKIRWGAWLSGLALGTLPLGPWFSAPRPAGGVRLGIHGVRFFTEWFKDGWGISLEEALGPLFWSRFVTSPHFAGVSTYGVGLLHAGLLAVGVFSVALSVKSIRRPLSVGGSAFTLAILAYGCTLNLLGIRFYPHYLILVYPFVHFWVAHLLFPRRVLFLGVLLAQLAITSSFLWFVHGAPDLAGTPYGVPYRRQISEGSP